MCMWEVGPSWCRNEASVELRRSRWVWATECEDYPRPAARVVARSRSPLPRGTGPGAPTAAPTLVPVGSLPEKLLLATPRGYCAGVDRAVQTVERALELYGAPIYVRKEIVHNKHVVDQLRRRGAVFVDSETEVPEGSTVVFSAHGVAPSVHQGAQQRHLTTIDPTSPPGTKGQVGARKFAAQGYTIVLVGHDGHEEVEGTMGEAPDRIVLVESVDDVDRL